MVFSKSLLLFGWILCLIAPIYARLDSNNPRVRGILWDFAFKKADPRINRVEIEGEYYYRVSQHDGSSEGEFKEGIIPCDADTPTPSGLPKPDNFWPDDFSPVKSAFIFGSVYNTVLVNYNGLNHDLVFLIQTSHGILEGYVPKAKFSDITTPGRPPMLIPDKFQKMFVVPYLSYSGFIIQHLWGLTNTLNQYANQEANLTIFGIQIWAEAQSTGEDFHFSMVVNAIKDQIVETLKKATSKEDTTLPITIIGDIPEVKMFSFPYNPRARGSKKPQTARYVCATACTLLPDADSGEKRAKLEVYFGSEAKLDPTGKKLITKPSITIPLIRDSGMLVWTRQTVPLLPPTS